MTEVTSEERKEGRYRRRMMRRFIKMRKKNPNAFYFKRVFSHKNLWISHKRCRRNVGHKGSVQRFKFAALIRVNRAKKKLHAGKYKCVTPFEWYTWERGILRLIKSVTIDERHVQRCLADNALIPVLGPTFIYDNGACMKFKGYDFAMRRLHCHLDRHYRKYGNEGYILLFDFSKFYENIDHNLIRSIIAKHFDDPAIRKMVDQILATFGDHGLGLGSQISQVLALAAGNALDHAIKQEMGIKGYARYNDDGYLIHHSKEYLQKCLVRIQAICDTLHIKLNMKKTHIVKLSHGFKFLKARIYLTSTGKIVRKIPKRSIVCERRKLKKLKIKMEQGCMDMAHIEMQYQSWRSFATKFDSWHAVQNMDKLYHNLYVFKEAA